MNGSAASPNRPSSAALLAAFAAVYLVWGSTYLAIRFAIETLPPFLMAGSRFLVAGALMYVWARRKRSGATRSPRPGLRQWAAAGIVGGLLLLGGNGGVVWAEQFVASGLTALIIATVPLWMVALEWARPGGSRPTRPILLGLIVGISGVAVLVGTEGALGAGVPLIPALVLVLASGSWAVGSLYSRTAPLPTSSVLSTALQMLTGGALLFLAGLLRGEATGFEVATVSLRSALALGYLIVFGSFIGFSAYIWLLRVSSPARVSTYAFVNPVVAVFLGWLLAAEPLNTRVGIATALVVAAVVLVTTNPVRRPTLRSGPDSTGSSRPD